MALVVTKHPQTSIKAKTSKWSAVHHPITFEFQRQDVNVTKANRTTQSGTTFTRIYASSFPTALTVGNKITYVVNGITYKTTVLRKYSSFIDVTQVAATNLTGGYLILKESYNSYYVEAQIYGVDASETYQLIGTTKCTDSDTGLVKINLQEWLQTQAVFQNKYGYNKINGVQFGEGGKFNIIWREVFNGVTLRNYFNTLSDVNAFYWVNSSKQIKDVYSQNMADYNPTIDGTRTDKAKFLSVFDKPTYFPNYPFSLSFIYSETLENKEVKRREVTKNINGTQVASTTDLLDMGGRSKVNRLMLKQSYPSTVKTIDIWLEAFSNTLYNPIHWTDDYSQDIFSAWGTYNPINLPWFINTTSQYE